LEDVVGVAETEKDALDAVEALDGRIDVPGLLVGNLDTVAIT